MALTNTDLIQMTNIVLMRHHVFSVPYLDATGYVIVKTPIDLDNIRNYPNNKYILMNDIDLAGWGNWNPIVNFGGVLEGNGYSILNMHVDNTANPRYGGLFGNLVNRAVIRNLGIINGYVKNGYVNTSARDYKALLSGISYYANISNCFVKGQVDIGTRRVGGFIGYASYTSIVNCYSVVSFLGNRSNLYSSGTFVGASEYDLACPHSYYDMTVDYIGGGVFNGAPIGSPIGITTSNLKSLNTYTKFFDFVHTWAIDPSINDGYPYLKAGLII